MNSLRIKGTSLSMGLSSRCIDCGTRVAFRVSRCDECQLKRDREIVEWNKTDIIRSIYQTSRWRKTREQVKLRDKGLCQLSLLEGKIVLGDEVHHINKLTKSTLDQAYDINNLILLSKEKHDMLHKKDIVNRKKFDDYVKSIPRVGKFIE